MAFYGFVAYFRAQNLIYFDKTLDFSTMFLVQNLIHIDSVICFFFSFFVLKVSKSASLTTIMVLK